MTCIDVEVDVVVGDLCGGVLFWREDILWLFFGEVGSLMCAHIDICL